ncbi:MAG: DNA polymerase domain-containing protein, partial [Nitrospinota bacterium]
FILGETGLEGLFELARVAKIPVQRTARTSTGTCISNMQLERAVEGGILVPWRKRQPEAFKTGLELLVTDKGGLTYQPVLGLHETVAEIDFSAMYPTIMATYNVSPETVGCACCGHVVPEIGSVICQRREGLVPKTLRPILVKRARYKALMAEATSDEARRVYDGRQSALKWMLVTCFGYLGYKNARFGRIEAHEAVTAYGREKLLQAKEVAEAKGFTLLHALTDSLWVRKEGATEAAYEALRREMARTTGLPIGLEGVYRWIAFLPSKTAPTMGVPNRFVGVFTDGRVKVRGIELRRSDTPRFVKKAQAEMIRVLTEARSREALTAKVDEALEVLAASLAELAEGRAPLHELTITKRLSKDPSRYEKTSLLAEAAGELACRGVMLRPGERVAYIITDFAGESGGPRARAYATAESGLGYDVAKYTDLLLEAAATLLAPFGYDYARLVEIT